MGCHSCCGCHCCRPWNYWYRCNRCGCTIYGYGWHNCQPWGWNKVPDLPVQRPDVREAINKLGG